jgi:hypothetical protein
MESRCEDARRLFSEFLEIVSDGSCWCYNLRADPLEPNSLSNLLDVESEFVDELLELTVFLCYALLFVVVGCIITLCCVRRKVGQEKHVDRKVEETNIDVLATIEDTRH